VRQGKTFKKNVKKMMTRASSKILLDGISIQRCWLLKILAEGERLPLCEASVRFQVDYQVDCRCLTILSKPNRTIIISFWKYFPSCSVTGGGGTGTLFCD